MSNPINNASSIEREIPNFFRRYKAGWFAAIFFWNFFNITIGGISAALGVVVAIKVGSDTPYITKEFAFVASIIAPILTFILTALKPGSTATSFALAHRELEKCLVAYQADPTRDNSFLSDGIARGLDILNKGSTV